MVYSKLQIIFLILFRDALMIDSNDTSKAYRKERVNGQIVKLSSEIPNTILCHREGFLGDQNDCSVFYRCMKTFDKYTVFRFQCAPGTIFDTVKEICNYPQQTQRSECRINREQKYVTEITNILSELPKPIFHTDQDTGLHKPLDDYNELSEDYQELNAGYQQAYLVTPSTTIASQTTHIYTRRPPYLTNRTEHFEDENRCNKDGFMGDTLDCRKFYRCVNNLRGGFIRYEFLCDNATIWDDSTQGCNHVWVARNLRCGQDNSIYNNLNNKINMGYGNKHNYNLNEYPIKQNIENSLEENYNKSNIGEAQTSTQKYGDIKIDVDTTTLAEKLHNIKPILDLAQMQFGDKILGYGDTESNVTPTEDKTYLSHNTIEHEKTNPPPDSYYRRNECVQNGFFGYSGDCKKFYRCVENSQGKYVRYDFSCSEGTLWDDNLKACNFASAVNECGSIAPLKDLTSTTSAYSNPSSLYTSSSPLSDENVGFITHTQINDEISSKPSTLTDSVFTMTHDTHQNECNSNGFYGDQNNCQIFYRCIETRRGVFTKLSYKCEEGTLWDPSIEACNHERAVKNCTISMSSSTTMAYSPVITTISLLQTTTQANEIIEQNYDAGYNQGSDQFIFSTPKDAIVNNSGSNKCTTSGFMADTKDCKKFHRCVDNGNGKFTQYEFSCGEGTVWDTKIESCNHAWAVEKCGETIVDKPPTHYSNATVVPLKPTENVESSTTTASDNLTSKSTLSTSNVVYGSSTTHSSFNEIHETSSSSFDLQDLCKSEGFYPDRQDCKKFYRCIDNGNGKYIKNEFTCGEGTAWDVSINSCNHMNNVKSCQGMSNEIDEVNTPIEFTSHTATEPTKPSTTSIKPDFNTISTTPMKCEAEGYFGNDVDCTKFYRCVANVKVGFEMYEYSCGEGTIWDQDIIACNHPQDVERPSCSTEYNVSTTMTGTEVSQTISTSYEQSPSKPIVSPTTPVVSFSTTTTTTSTSTIILQSLNNKDCDEEGFFGDSSDCKTFYRCVNDGKGQYIKYVFSCGEGTIWDQDILACNHPQNVKKFTCIENASHYSTTTKKYVPNAIDLESSKVASNPTPFPITTTVHFTTVSVTDFYDKESTMPKPIEQTIASSSSSNMKPVNQNICFKEGYFGHTEDCNKFHRCVDSGNNEFIKYDFTCGEGTIWDQDILACNHPRDVNQSTCLDNNNDYTTTKIRDVSSTSNNPTSKVTSNSTPLPATTTSDSTTVSSTELHDKATSTTLKPNDQTTVLSTTYMKPISQNTCSEQGYFGDTEDCKKFYRCVDNGKNEFTKYDFTCGEGTIWDQDIIACNHPQDVQHLSCSTSISSVQSTTTEKQSHQTSISTQTSSMSTSSPQHINTSSTLETSISPSKTTAFTSSTSTITTESSSVQNNENQNSTDPQQTGNFTCTEAGFYPNPSDCKKFYRCVDWNNDGSSFTIFHFECGEGTVWDPSLDTCNYENSIYPPRNCTTLSNTETSGSSSTDTTTEQATTTMTSSKPTKSSTEQSTSTSTTELSSSTTEQSTSTSTSEQSSSTTEQSTSTSTTEQSSSTVTTEQSTSTSSTEQSSSTSTTEQSTSAAPTDENSSTQTTQQQTSTTEKTTTQTGASSTDQSTATNSPESTSTERTTTPMDQTTQTDKSTEESSTSEATTQASSTEPTEADKTTTEITQQTTETSTSSTPKDKCPEMKEDQYAYVCPTSFRQHPKYCNLFYQCTEDDDSHDLKIALFHCPNNTIYDETKIQCVEKNKASKTCDGSMSQTHRIKRFSNDYIEPIIVGTESYACPSVGYFPFERNQDCSQAMIKCQRSKNNKLNGYVFKCPEEYTFWSKSKRCEKLTRIRDCKRSIYPWDKRYEIPNEISNVALY